jgi:uncharacterized protein (TIGR02231 family)
VIEHTLEKRQDPQNLVAHAKVSAVVIMEDRAQVFRRAKVDLSVGRTLVHVKGATPLVADRTLRCRLKQSGAAVADARGRVLDMRVERSYVTRPARPERERELVQTIEKSADEYRSVYDRIRTLLHERKLLDGAGKSVAQQVSDRLAVGAFDASAKSEIDTLTKRRTDVEGQALALQWQQLDRRQRIEALEEELRLALQPVSDYQATLFAEVTVVEAGAYELEWEYLVPCALWRPEYSAELRTEAGKTRLHWISGGTVWQATGEDWTEAMISLSTARPSLGADLPFLADDILKSRDKSDEEKRTIEVTSREEVIQTTTRVRQEKRSDTPPGVDDGGETRVFAIRTAISVPADGRPHRLIFETWDADAEAELLCIPSKACFVFERSLQTNPSAMPLLAGPVALIKNGGFIGRSEVAYVAPGERFELAWGSEDNLVVLRDQTREAKETKIRKVQEIVFKVAVYFANHTAAPATVRLIERVPVSEIAAVKVAILEKETTVGFDKDDQGLLTWRLSLPPRTEERVKLGFEVSMPSNVRWDG